LCLSVAFVDQETDLSEAEFLVLACDGIWNVKTSQEVIDFVRERLAANPDQPLSNISSELCDECMAPDTSGDGSGCDNMTVVIVQFNAPASSLLALPVADVLCKRASSENEINDVEVTPNKKSKSK
jgi:serine/threonine protein phosphatase PrpC